MRLRSVRPRELLPSPSHPCRRPRPHGLVGQRLGRAARPAQMRHRRAPAPAGRSARASPAARRPRSSPARPRAAAPRQAPPSSRSRGTAGRSRRHARTRRRPRHPTRSADPTRSDPPRQAPGARSTQRLDRHARAADDLEPHPRYTSDERRQRLDQHVEALVGPQQPEEQHRLAGLDAFRRLGAPRRRPARDAARSRPVRDRLRPRRAAARVPFSECVITRSQLSYSARQRSTAPALRRGSTSCAVKTVPPAGRRRSDREVELGEGRPLPVHDVRPMPPRACASDRESPAAWPASLSGARSGLRGRARTSCLSAGPNDSRRR